MDLSERPSEAAARHPWEVARARAIEAIVVGERPRAGRILDYGCGDGFAGLELLKSSGGSAYVGLDTNLTDEQCASWTRADGRIRFMNGALPAETRFDTILLCDVIEHVADDVSLLRGAWSRLAPGGVLLITVPAFQALFTRHDQALRHFRRYSRRQLLAQAASAELPIHYSGYLFASLLPARGAFALGERLRGQRDAVSAVDVGIGNWNAPPWVTRAISAVLTVDNMALLGTWRRGFGLPGLTTFAVCRHSE